MKLVTIADLRDPDDPQGRTYREVNAAQQHAIPIGALVEVKSKGIRLYVVYHARDCDQTPLYCLCHDQNDTERRRLHFYNHGWDCGYPEESLLVIRLPEEK